MDAYRKYYNAADDLIREDRISVALRTNYTDISKHSYSSDSLKVRHTVSIKTNLVYGPSGAGTRVVDRIEVTGDFSSCETVTGDYTWLKWVLGNSQEILADLTHLPVVGDTV